MGIRDPISAKIGHGRSTLPRATAPQLTSLALNLSGSTLSDFPSMPLDLFLENTGPSSAEVLQILQNCPDLRNLELRGRDRHPRGRAVMDVELLSLTRLELSDLMEDVVSSMLASISAPLCAAIDLAVEFNGRSTFTDILPSGDQFARSFPAIYQRLRDASSVVLSGVNPSSIDLAVKVKEDCCLQLAFEGCSASSMLEWLEQITPELKKKPAEVEFDCSLIRNRQMLDVLDDVLDVVELTTSPDKAMEDVQEILDYLGNARLVSRGRHGPALPFPNLRDLWLMTDHIAPASILEMVKSRYGATSANIATQNLPKPFDQLFV